MRGEDSQGMGMVRRALDAALASDDPSIPRLTHADTSVGFALDGDSVTLRLQGEEPELADGRAEVQIRLPADGIEDFTGGRLAMTDAVASGYVTTEGPVRKYLEVDPILRRALRRAAGDEAQPRSRSRYSGGPIDADLLALETRGLRKRFGRNKVLDGLDLSIPEGVIYVILGPSGTGKSVLLQHVIGLMEPDGGDVLVRGQVLGDMSRADLLDLRRGIGVMFQDGALFSNMDVYDNVAFPLRQHTDLEDDEVEGIVRDRLESVGLGDAADRMPNELSGGMRKRAGLARALALDPSIVLCDEPDSGLDPVRTSLLADLLVEQHGQQGGTMVVVTHNVALARHIADQVAVVWRGEVLEAGSADALFSSETPFIQQFLHGAADGPLGMDA